MEHYYKLSTCLCTGPAPTERSCIHFLHEQHVIDQEAIKSAGDAEPIPQENEAIKLYLRLTER